ncbi:hypothetical protein D3C78_1895900 [compost metagenome]
MGMFRLGSGERLKQIIGVECLKLSRNCAGYGLKQLLKDRSLSVKLPPLPSGRPRLKQALRRWRPSRRGPR